MAAEQETFRSFRIKEYNVTQSVYNYTNLQSTKIHKKREEGGRIKVFLYPTKVIKRRIVFTFEIEIDQIFKIVSNLILLLKKCTPKKILPPFRLIFATLSPDDLEQSTTRVEAGYGRNSAHLMTTGTRVRLDGTVLTVYAKPYLRDVYKRGTVVI